LTPGRPDNLAADLSAYLDGELPEVRAREIEQQLADSAECRALLAELRDVSQALGRLPRRRAPDELVAALRHQAERRHLFGDARRPRTGRVLRLFLRLSAAAAVIGGCVLVGWHVADRGQTRPRQTAPRDYALVDRPTPEAAAPPELARAEHDGAPALPQKAAGAGTLAEQLAEAAEPLPTDAALAHGTVADDDAGTAVAAREPEPMLPAAPAPAPSAAPAPTVAARTPAARLPRVLAEVEIYVVPHDSSAHATARCVLASLGEAALSDEQDRMGVTAAGRERSTVVRRAVPADEVAAFMADLQARLPEQTTVTMQPSVQAGALPRGAPPTASTAEAEVPARALMAGEAERVRADAPRRGAGAGRYSAHRDIAAEDAVQAPPTPPRRSDAGAAFELTWRGWRAALQSAWRPAVQRVHLRIMLLEPAAPPAAPTPSEHP